MAVTLLSLDIFNANDRVDIVLLSCGASVERSSEDCSSVVWDGPNAEAVGC